MAPTQLVSSIKIGGASYEVVGVLAEQGQTIAGNPDNNVYIPITTAQTRLYTLTEPAPASTL
jgi:hypothetical protein